ncbi:hypothetical protein [Fimbriiglobus ruber]|uniref:Uncharacterized protein n=1 Tax=Fimbriiglobus ruber TaxID=1908690 RepID=A0A225DBT5_9BACT|nr:hypothetical protein [Fimbriiglobus ruber]OWK39050.1 hypothetical protein FRUB_06132 [Fimbriiglobus ruber]
MATTFTVTIRLQCWKEHHCVGCGTAFRYLFAREVKGTGGAARTAERSAHTRAARVITKGTDPHPCPTCGRFQPEMIARPLAARHAWTSAAGALAVLAVVVLGGTHASAWLTYSAAGLAAAVVTAVATLVHITFARRNPNADLVGNRARAAHELNAGVVQIVKSGDADRADKNPPRKPFAKGHLLAAGLGFLAAVVLAAPFITKGAAGWPSNSGVPEVVGSGEQIVVYFDDSVDALKGHWRGQAKAEVAADEGPGCWVRSSAHRRGMKIGGIRSRSAKPGRPAGRRSGLH